MSVKSWYLAVANAAGRHNENFDRSRFYTACGV